jgi:hypothetical protein
MVTGQPLQRKLLLAEREELLDQGRFEFIHPPGRRSWGSSPAKGCWGGRRWISSLPIAGRSFPERLALPEELRGVEGAAVGRQRQDCVPDRFP